LTITVEEQPPIVPISTVEVNEVFITEEKEPQPTEEKETQLTETQQVEEPQLTEEKETQQVEPLTEFQSLAKEVQSIETPGIEHQLTEPGETHIIQESPQELPPLTQEIELPPKKEAPRKQSAKKPVAKKQAGRR
jgi:hypothetical protein